MHYLEFTIHLSYLNFCCKKILLLIKYMMVIINQNIKSGYPLDKLNSKIYKSSQDIYRI